jgi:hypothetical protein
MEKQLNETSETENRRKKTLTRFGEIAIVKTNPYMEGVRHGFGISPYMQELMTYASRLECYARSHEILEQFLSIEVRPSQVYRVTDQVSESLKAEDEMTERTLPPVSQANVLCVETDGYAIRTVGKRLSLPACSGGAIT